MTYQQDAMSYYTNYYGQPSGTPIYGQFNTNSGNDGSSAPPWGWMGYDAGGSGFSTGAQSPWGNAVTTNYGYLQPGSLRPLGTNTGNGYIGANGQLVLPGSTYSPYGTGGYGGAGGAGGAGGGLNGLLPADDGRRDFVHDDFVNAALGRLNDVQNGTSLPYDAATVNSMMSHATDMNAAAEAQQAQSLREAAAAGGASLNDPSTQAAMRELTSKRQGANMNAAQAIDQEANRANFNARQDANNQMADLRFRQLSSSTSAAQPTPGGTATYRPGTGGSGGTGGSSGGFNMVNGLPDPGQFAQWVNQQGGYVNNTAPGQLPPGMYGSMSPQGTNWGKGTYTKPPPGPSTNPVSPSYTGITTTGSKVWQPPKYIGPTTNPVSDPGYP